MSCVKLLAIIKMFKKDSLTTKPPVITYTPRAQLRVSILSTYISRMTVTLRVCLLISFFPFLVASSPFITSSGLTLNVSCISESCIDIKIKLNFYFHTSLWCLKRFYEGFKGLEGIKPFEAPQRIVKIKI